MINNLQVNQIQAVLMICGALLGTMVDGLMVVVIGIILGYIIGKLVK